MICRLERAKASSLFRVEKCKSGSKLSCVKIYRLLFSSFSTAANLWIAAFLLFVANYKIVDICGNKKCEIIKSMYSLWIDSQMFCWLSSSADDFSERAESQIAPRRGDSLAAPLLELLQPEPSHQCSNWELRIRITASFFWLFLFAKMHKNGGPKRIIKKSLITFFSLRTKS